MSLLEKIMKERNITDADLTIEEISKSDSAMEIANTLQIAIKEQFLISIMGDYDVDGCTSTVMLIKTLWSLGYENIEFQQSDRYQGGYGISRDMIDKVTPGSIAILLDCGTNSIEEIIELQKKGCRIIVIDHHELTNEVPKDVQLYNPLANEDRDEFKLKCTAGLVLKVCLELNPEMENFIYTLAMLGTLGDAVPLLGENRYIVKQGLKVYKQSKCTSLLYLMEVLKLNTLTVETIQFKINPMLNAPGRLGSPTDSIYFLLGTGILAHKLIQTNEKRKEMSKELYDKYSDIEYNSTFILINDNDISRGLAGILAGKLSEKFNKICLVITEGIGSARTAGGINIYELLNNRRDLFERLGGHSGAAGFRISQDNIKALGTYLHDSNIVYTETKNYDLEVDIEELTLDSLRSLSKLEPFGEGNSKPIFLCKDVQVDKYKFVGKKEDVLQLWLGPMLTQGVYFNCKDTPPDKVCFTCEMEDNVYNGKSKLQLMIKNLW